MKYDPNILANIIALLTNQYVTCQYNAEEGVFIFRVFMVPTTLKKSIKREIKEYLEKFHEEGWDIFYSVLVFDVNQTKEYYPEKVMPPKTPSPAAICAQPADDDESLAA